ncbi:hypothetical protein L226DRAFT_565988 [Lentinus tigrinus ALCF2SS1-7]|uniref:Uncharacterized protein n=1 Tax=Lentinus tigrinus ALCF2SS1-6 TaxID=1328759 RepID=A0A5C2STR8_9APHY|nr:hypothetical protein L227DRAFT_605652 [Lentinus tigrinus ALCF2SS1-6]RPD81192.1 hypothetical protein L226DRAFT_565988 [Lentinus tigrinus ALCF2SS1-7]
MSAVLQSLVLTALAYSSAQRISGRFRAAQEEADSSDGEAPEVVESVPARSTTARRGRTPVSRSMPARHRAVATPASTPPATPASPPPAALASSPPCTGLPSRSTHHTERTLPSSSRASANSPLHNSARPSPAPRSVHWTEPVAPHSRSAASDTRYPVLEVLEDVKLESIPMPLPVLPPMMGPHGALLMPESASMAGRMPARHQSPKSSASRTSSSRRGSSVRVGRLAGPRLNDPYGLHYRAFRGFAGQTDEAGDPIGTYWFQSQSEATIGAPPDFSGVQNVRVGDVYIHKMPIRCQLWLWAVADGVNYWHPVSEGYRRADGRKLQITKGLKEPSWIL